MPLESTMVCLDNSEYMRNGDYTPTRYEAQHDAANLICGSKTQSNPESTVGVLTMAGGTGAGVQVLTSPTDDMGKILTACSTVQIGGQCNFAGALQIAQLALKHRKNKNGGQRIVVFIGSPVTEDEKKLTKIAKQLKKSNVAVDIVSMGESDGNDAKLEAFVETVNKNSNSRLVSIPAGVLPSDVLISSPIVTGEEGTAGGGGSGGGGGGGGGGGAFAEYGGVDPNLDPELALALRVSLEEARAEAERNETSSTSATGENGASAPAAASAAGVPGEGNTVPDATAANAGGGDTMEGVTGMSEEDALLQQALMMSIDDAGDEDSGAGDNGDQVAAAATSAVDAPTAASGDAMEEDNGDEDEEAMRLALAMSMAEEEEGSTEKDPAPAPAVPVPVAVAPPDAPTATGASEGSAAAQFLDPSFVSSLLSGLPGVDINDPAIQAAMQQLSSGNEAKKDEGEKKDGDK